MIKQACIFSTKRHKSTIYAGVGSGNPWKTVNNGTTWKPAFENESTFSVAVVTVCDQDTNLVWVETGEPHMARSSFAGTGVFDGYPLMSICQSPNYSKGGNLTFWKDCG